MKYFDNACRILKRDHAERVRDAVVALDRSPAAALGDILAKIA